MIDTKPPQSPMLKVQAAVTVFRAASLRAFSLYDHMVGHHVRIDATGDEAGYYIVNPAAQGQFRVRWIPESGPIVALGHAETAARAAGIVLDHQDLPAVTARKDPDPS